MKWSEYSLEAFAAVAQKQAELDYLCFELICLSMHLFSSFCQPLVQATLSEKIFYIRNANNK